MSLQAPKPARCRHGHSGGGFSLVEVTLALGLVAFALVASFGLVLVGLNSAKDSVDDTVSSLIFQDAITRLDGRPLEAGAVGTWAFDKDGVPVESASDPRAYYEAEVKLVPPANLPPETDCLAAVVTVRWPLVKGALQPAEDRTLVETTLVTTATPPAWQETQATFKPKIDL